MNEIHCSHPECPNKIKNHRWGKTKASGWFFTRDNEKAYCPAHIPDWVEAWRKRKKETPTNEQ